MCVHLLDCVEPDSMLMSCVIIWPHCMLASVNFGSGTSASPNTTSDTSRELGNGSPVTEAVGADTPSPYLADSRRE